MLQWLSIATPLGMFVCKVEEQDIVHLLHDLDSVEVYDLCAVSASKKTRYADPSSTKTYSEEEARARVFTNEEGESLIPLPVEEATEEYIPVYASKDPLESRCFVFSSQIVFAKNLGPSKEITAHVDYINGRVPLVKARGKHSAK
jgi:hypothetical protein